MRAVLTRVKSASVVIDGKVNGKIGRGFLILLGVGPEDKKKSVSTWQKKPWVCGSLRMKTIR